MSALARTVQMYKAIAHPARLRLLAMLRGGPLCVCQMTVVVKLAGSTVSEHLSELKKAGLIVERKDGRWVEYRLVSDRVAVAILDEAWSAIAGDPSVKADALVARELRRIPLDELCSAGLNLGKLERPRLTAAVKRAARLRRDRL